MFMVRYLDWNFDGMIIDIWIGLLLDLIGIFGCVYIGMYVYVCMYIVFEPIDEC